MSALEKYYKFYKLYKIANAPPTENAPPSEVPQNFSNSYINLLIKRALLFGLIGGGLAALSPVLLKHLEKEPIALRTAILKGLPAGIGLGAITGLGEASLEALNRINYAINTGQMEKYQLPPGILQALSKLEEKKEVQ